MLKELREKKSRLFFSDVLCRSAKKFCVTMSILKVNRSKLRDNYGSVFDWECFATIVCMGIRTSGCGYSLLWFSVEVLCVIIFILWRCLFDNTELEKRHVALFLRGSFLHVLLGLISMFSLLPWKTVALFHVLVRCSEFSICLVTFLLFISSFELRCFSSVFASPR